MSWTKVDKEKKIGKKKIKVKKDGLVVLGFLIGFREHLEDIVQK